MGKGVSDRKRSKPTSVSEGEEKDLLWTLPVLKSQGVPQVGSGLGIGIRCGVGASIALFGENLASYLSQFQNERLGMLLHISFFRIDECFFVMVDTIHFRHR